MAAESLSTRQFNFHAPPTNGGIVCVAAGTSVTVIDLTSMAGWPGNLTNGTEQSPVSKAQNPLGHYISLEADTTDVYVAFASTTAALSTISVSSVTAVSGNQLAANNTANGTVKIPVNTIQPFKLHEGQNPATTPWGANASCRYLGIITATTSGVLRCWQSSP